MADRAPDDPAPRRARTSWIGPAILGVVSILYIPGFLRLVVSVYDAGLFLTMARFLDLAHLPYRDLWTLYGPGPPILSSVVMDMFGQGLGPQRISLVLVHLLVVAAAYLVARRFVAAWIAGVLVALFAALIVPFHFEQSIGFLLWGVWFVLRAADDHELAPRRLAIAAVLFGLSFWGRFELVPLGMILVVGLWLAVRGKLDVRSRRRLLWLGLAPLVAFLLYIVAVVGPERAWLNLVEYPFLRYSDSACRGLPDVWGAAASAFLAPFTDHVWSTYELVLWTATLLAPILGILCLVVAAMRRRAAALPAFAIAAVGAITLLLWVEHRPRASASPYAVIPLVMVSAAILLGVLRSARPRAGFVASIVATFAVALTLVTSWVPDALPAWRDWPPYDDAIGWEGGRFEGLYDETVWSEVASEVQQRTEPGEEIFVALTDNRTHFANAPIFYWVVDRPPASRFIEFNPCLTDTAQVQREIVADLARVDVIVATTFFPDLRRDPTTGPTILDDELTFRFEPVYEGTLPGDQAVFVLERRS